MLFVAALYNDATTRVRRINSDAIFITAHTRIVFVVIHLLFLCVYT